MNTAYKAILVCAAAALMATQASAAILVDESPDKLGGIVYSGFWTNYSQTQNFLVQFSLSSAEQITGFDIFTGEPVNNGAMGTLKLRADSSGVPASTNFLSENLSISVDKVGATSPSASGLSRLHVDLSSAETLAAGTYWMGLSGTAADIGWASMDAGGPVSPADQRQLYSDLVVSQPSIYDLAFQVEGISPAVPEPSTWAMMILGFAGIGFTAYRWKSKPVLMAA